jgi:predicted nucleic acid-binding protein
VGVVVDTSVIIAYHVPEVGSAAAVATLERGDAIIVPDLLRIEALNAVTNLIRKRRITTKLGEQVLAAISGMRLDYRDHESLLPAAQAIALDYGRTAYDSVFVALAAYLDTPLLTLDASLARALAATPYAPWVRCIG